MFVSFLYPFRLRGRLAPYLWVAYKQIGDLSPEQVCFIASAAYRVDPAHYAAAHRFECSAPRNDELGFAVPAPTRFADYAWYDVPDEIWRQLKRDWLTDGQVWLRLIRDPEPRLTAYLRATLAMIQRQRKIRAILAWCHCASLSAAARALDLPVIHCELGPLRDPWYRPLGYVDFRSVNGDTEAAARFQRFLVARRRPAPLSRAALLDLLRGPRYDPGTDEPAAYALGVALQVEDDANVLAYHEGFTPALVLEYALEDTPAEQVLIRPHPAGHFGPPRRGVIDRSPTSMAFVRRCRALLTLNSSVAVEALLAGVPTRILGQSPARIVSAAPPRLAAAALDFLLLGYCVPYRLIFSAEYFLWRLTQPSEEAIRQYHLERLRNPDD